MQVALPNLIRQAETGQMLSAGYGGAGIAFIDARDIADVAVHQLLARDIASKPAILSGPAIVDLREIAGILARLLHRPVAVADAAVTPIIAADASFEHRAVAQFKGLIAAGRAAYATEAVSDILGRAPRSVEQFLTEHLTAACFAEPRTGARS
jgi:nucleoside-diphosphate-sugar epimerase